MLVGVRSGLLLDPGRTDWSGTGPRPIAWTAWYPAAEGSIEARMQVGGQGEPWFEIGLVARDAPLQGSDQAYPVAMISHGTGGSALGLGWLGRRLAGCGIVALAPNHHGNTALEPPTAEGFVCWWERAADCSLLLDGIAALPDFAGRLDLGRVLAVGYSLGAHTALALLGPTTDMERYGAWAGDGPFSRGPANFPDLADRLPGLLAESEVFRASWARQGLSYKDPRFDAALLLAPAPPVRAFSEAGLEAILERVHIVTGGSDQEAPAAIGAEWLAEHLPRCTLDVVAQGGHFIFLPEGTAAGKREMPQLCVDATGIDRASIHDAVAAAACSLLAL